MYIFILNHTVFLVAAFVNSLGISLFLFHYYTGKRDNIGVSTLRAQQYRPYEKKSYTSHNHWPKHWARPAIPKSMSEQIHFDPTFTRVGKFYPARSGRD